MTPGMLVGAFGQRHLDTRQAMAVGGHRAQASGLLAGVMGMQIDAVQVIAGLLGGDGEAGAGRSGRLQIGRGRAGI